MAIQRLVVDQERSRIRFSLRHLVVAEISGFATRFRGNIRFDPADPTESQIEVILESASLETGDVERDQHIRSVEFLNAKEFPEIRFRSRRIVRGDGGHYTLAGDLTIRDVCRQVAFDIEDRAHASSAASRGILGPFVGKGIVNRQEFGLRWNQDLDAGGVVVGDKVSIYLSIEVATPQFEEAELGEGDDPNDSDTGGPS